jgi:hypothetical protein
MARLPLPLWLRFLLCVLPSIAVTGRTGVLMGAQEAPVSPASAGTAAQSAAPSPNPDDAWLAKTGSLYYSSAKAGLGGFDCIVHPDWRTLFQTANDGSTIAADDTRIQLLQTVKINLHAQLGGNSSLDWVQDPNPAKPLDEDESAMLHKMRQVTEETLEGFLQFWAPFVDGSVVPETADGLEITHAGGSHTIHAEQGGTALTEIFSNDLLLKNFNVNMNGTSIRFQPDYKATEQGLLVSSFQAHVQPAGVPSDQAQDMHVDIDYKTLEGFPIPSRLNMDVSDTGKFSFVLDGCTVSRLQKPGTLNAVKPALQ